MEDPFTNTAGEPEFEINGWRVLLRGAALPTESWNDFPNLAPGRIIYCTQITATRPNASIGDGDEIASWFEGAIQVDFADDGSTFIVSEISERVAPSEWDGVHGGSLVEPIEVVMELVRPDTIGGSVCFLGGEFPLGEVLFAYSKINGSYFDPRY